MTRDPIHNTTKDPYADPTGVLCPQCKMYMIVYNGNYFCSGENRDCGWVLPQPDPWRKTKKNKRLEQRCIDGLMQYRRDKAKA